MKTMKCSDFGGPCGEEFHGETGDDVIKAYNQHLNDAVASGDDSHKPELEAMQARWKNPAGSMDWYNKTKANFEALPEDAA